MITLKEAIENRDREAEAFIIAQREQVRKVMLLVPIWMTLFPLEQRKEAEKNIRAIFQPLRDTTKQPLIYLEEIYRNNSCPENTFIEQHIDKIKVVLEYFLGYRPELEKNIPPVLLKQAKEKSLSAVAKEMSETLEVKPKPKSKS